MSDRPIFTYQTRLELTADESAVLDAYAALHGKAERSLFAALQAGRSVNDLKRDFLPRFGITARQFNAIKVGLEGKIDSIKARQPERIAETETRLKRAEKVIAKLQARSPGSNKLHQKKRRYATLKDRCTAMKADHQAGTVRLCFGSRQLFRAQFTLGTNGYGSHGDWKRDWTAARNNQFFVLGSQDETAGNQTCQARCSPDGSLTLRLRLPDALGGKTLEIPGVRFAYGQDQIEAALASGQRVSTITKTGKRGTKRTGAALSYRFVRDDTGWRVFVSVEARPVAQTTSRLAGAIGVDINADHLAVSETDRFGNLVAHWRIDLNLYGKTHDQAKALIGDAVVEVARLAQVAGKPLVIERLNFAKKKAELEAVDPALARMLSSFACNRILSNLKAAAFRAGVEVIEVNPAYTSVIGSVNHAQVRGISVHMGAALAIARRGLGGSEKPIKRSLVVPARNGGHVTFVLPVRNRAKHVWSQWSAIRTQLKAAHVAHVRSGGLNSPPAPLSPAMQTLGATWTSTAKPRGANRDQHCSGSRSR